MNARTPRRAAPCLLAFALLCGCTDSVGSARGGGGADCVVNADCPLPERCFEGRCALECRVDSDCADGEQCVDSVCDDPLTGCVSDADCRAFGLVCDVEARRCVRPVLDDMDVPRRDRGVRDASGDVPILDAEPPDAARPDARLPDARLPDARLPDAALPDAALPDMGPIRGDARYGDPCRCGADCASGFCLQNPYNGFAGQCSARCGAGAEQGACPGIDRCVMARMPGLAPGCPDPGTGLAEGDIVEICAPNETGVPCRGGADCVIDGLCITPPDPLAGAAIRVQPVCGARCADDRGCPPGFRCQDVPTQGGQVVRACGAATQIAACPDGSNRTCGGVCPLGPGDDPLDISHCLVIDDGPGGYCSCACRNVADCPLGFACSRGVIDTGDPRRPGICLPIAGYTCPVAGDEGCLSLLCTSPVGNDPFDRCTAPCTGPADCPQGYSCLRPPGAQLDVCAVQ